MWGLLLPDGRLLEVGPNPPASLVYEEEGVQQTGQAVPIDLDDLTQEQRDTAAPATYDPVRRARILDDVRWAALQQAAAEAAQAAGQLGPSKAAVKAALVQALADMDQEESRAEAVKAEAVAMLAAIAADPPFPTTATTVPQLRGHVISAVTLLSGRIKTLAEHTRDAATGADRNIERTRQTIKLLCSLAGVPVPGGGQGFGGGGGAKAVAVDETGASGKDKDKTDKGGG